MGSAALTVRELVRLTEDVRRAIELLGAYDRGDRRAVIPAWDLLWDADERLQAARDHARNLRAE